MTQTAPPDEQGLIESATEPGPGLEAEALRPGSGGPDEAGTKDTRERILHVALDLFTEQGFDGTSLRQIAERLGVTKAALYYHFESKDDILLALHMRLHEFGREALVRMGDGPVTLAQWGQLLGEMVDEMLAQRQLFLMHQRNQAALEKLHREEHDADHEDIQNRFRRVLADPRVPLRDRVRMAASAGAVFSGFFLSGDSFADCSPEELGQLLREVLRDVVGG
jgi:AcrR family transcriptional regulator